MKRTEGGTALFSSYRDTAEEIMGDLMQLRGLQLVIIFKPVFSDGSCEEVSYKTGPFPHFQSVRKWLLSFIDHFQLDFEQEKEIRECRIASSEAVSYDPRDVMVLHPMRPEFASQEALDLILAVAGDCQSNSIGPFLWKAIFQVEMDDGIPLTTIAVSEPFAERGDIPRWCTPFLQYFQRQAKAKNIQYELEYEEIIAKRRHNFGEDGEYLLDASLDPEKGARAFLGDILHSIIAASNVR